LDKTLGEVRTLAEIPPFSYPKFVQRSSTIDVIWFNQRGMPNSLFEVESTADIKNSLGKYSDLQDFYTRMLIVADKARKEEFKSIIDGTSFEAIKKRVQFLDYDSLVKQYEFAMESESFETIV